MPISRRTTYTANTTIDPDIHNLEHDDYVSGINANAVEIANCVKLTGDQTIAGNKGFSSVPYTTGGDPTTDNSLTRKAYADGLLKGFINAAAPVYVSATTISMAYFNVSNSLNTGNIKKTTSSTIDLNTTGLNGIAQSSATLAGMVSLTSGSTTITGSGTTFLADFQLGDILYIPSLGYNFRITAIASDTSMTGHTTSGVTQSGLSYKRGGKATDTWYYLYAITDGTTSGLLVSNRNLALSQSMIDLPYTSSSLSGTVATTSGSSQITGTGTTFLADYKVGDNIVIAGGNQLTIASITNDTTMTATTNATVTVSGKTHSRVRYQIRQFSFVLRTDSSGNILPFRVGTGWPYRPKIIYPHSGYAINPYTVLSGGSSTSWSTIGMGVIVPPVSRLVDLGFYTTVNSNTGATGNSYVRETGTGTAGNLAGVSMYVSASGEYIVDVNSIADFPCNASSQIDYYVYYSGMVLWVWVNGFTITEIN